MRGSARLDDQIGQVARTPLIRLGELILEQWYGITPFGLDYHYRCDTQADALAAGCLLALVRERAHQQAWYRCILASRWMVLTPVMVLAISDVQPWSHPALLPLYAVPGFTLMNLAIALSLDVVMTHHGGTVAGALSWQPVARVGVLSYSIYTWQEVFLRPNRPAWYTDLPPALFLLTAFALASYYGVERPFLRLPRRAEQFDQLLLLHARCRRDLALLCASTRQIAERSFTSSPTVEADSRKSRLQFWP